MGKLRSPLEPASEMQIALISDLVKDRQGHPETDGALTMMRNSMGSRGFIPEAMALQIISKLANIQTSPDRDAIVRVLHNALVTIRGSHVTLHKDFVRQVYDYIQATR